MKAWHFTKNGTLRNGKPIPSIGVPLKWDGPLVMCESGLHASERIIDALTYAPGSTCHRVECGGEIKHDTDKLLCRERTRLWTVDADACLRAFARWCALQVVDQWKAPDVAVRYLRTGDPDLRSAAARAAARDAAWYATRGAATAWAAARGAAWAAARDAAWARRHPSASTVHNRREGPRENKQLETMIRDARSGRAEWTWEG